jgi:hypothetical protein
MATEQTMLLTAPVTCPGCGRDLTGRWSGDRRTAAQQCHGCGHVFTATWPGWQFQPERVTVAETPPWETVTCVRDARTVNPLAASHSPRSAGRVAFHRSA